ncbi:MAG: 5'-nucleotidase C-terminal domain-containing protein [Clostridiales bacterium]|nr:5'-nucleotidase C-terminal domain-containing protein [Clostridiales bacterium]
MKRTLAVISALILAVMITPAALAADGEKAFELIFTHDMHSRFLPDGDSGGFARVASILMDERARAGADGIPSLTVDGGDFSMGSLFQTLYSTEAAELRMLGLMGYDAATFGNHEFDYRGEGFADMLDAAAASGDPIPALVEANYAPPAPGQDGYGETARHIAEAMENIGVRDYIVIERGGIRFAVFGINGKESHDFAPESGMVLLDPIERSRELVAEIRSRENPDYIICLSHSGTKPEPDKSEDELLAKAVDGIDIIVSAHTHTVLAEPIIVNGTVIASCGAYTKYVGSIRVSKRDGGISADEYRLIETAPSVPEEAQTAYAIEAYKKKADEGYLAGYGMSFDETLAVSPFAFTPGEDFGHGQSDDPLGGLIADSYIYTVREAEGADYVPVDLAVVPAGVIRGTFGAGGITVSDAFNVSPLGAGADGTPGYPLISVYLYGREVRDAFEVDASITPIMGEAQLYTSGMEYAFNVNRLIFNKVTGAWIREPDGGTAPIEDDRLYRCVTGLYSGQMLGSVNAKSFGILTITPRGEDGEPVTDFETRIIRDTSGGEVKEWYALASYLRSLGTVPDKYSAPMGRKNITASVNPIDLLKSPNWVTLTVIGASLALTAGVILVVRAVVRRNRKRRA